MGRVKCMSLKKNFAFPVQNPLGTRYLYLADCRTSNKIDTKSIAGLVDKICKAGGLKVRDTHVTKFKPCGLTYIAVLQESHLVIQTWDEFDRIEIEIASCVGFDIQKISKCIRDENGFAIIGETLIQKELTKEGKVVWKRAR
jgi:S-adenosylmethionine/arginine decarboxylase-like enzyme